MAEGSLYKKKNAEGKPSSKWYGAFMDAETRSRVIKALYTDKGRSRKRLNELIDNFIEIHVNNKQACCTGKKK